MNKREKNNKKKRRRRRQTKKDILTRESHRRTHGRATSVTRSDDLLIFGQLFKARGNNYFAQIAHILGNFWKVVGIFHFAREIIFWATFIDIWRFFTDHTAGDWRPSRSHRLKIKTKEGCCEWKINYDRAELNFDDILAVGYAVCIH